MNGLFALSASKTVSAVLAAFVRCLRCCRVSFFLGFSLLLLKQPKRRLKMDIYVIYACTICLVRLCGQTVWISKPYRDNSTAII